MASRERQESDAPEIEKQGGKAGLIRALITGSQCELQGDAGAHATLGTKLSQGLVASRLRPGLLLPNGRVSGEGDQARFPQAAGDGLQGECQGAGAAKCHR